MTKFVSLVFVLSFILAGCGILEPRTPEYGVGPGPIYHSSKTYKQLLEKEHQILSEKPSCCLSYEEINYIELVKVPLSITLKFDNSSNVYQFQTGKSYVHGVKLPKVTNPYKIRFISDHETTTVKVTSGGFFYPVAAVLNSNFEIVKELTEKDFSFFADAGFAFHGRKGLSAELMIDHSILDESRYLIVYTTDKLMAEKSKYMFTGSGVYRAPDSEEEIMAELRNGYSWLVLAPNVPVGKVRLDLFHID